MSTEMTIVLAILYFVFWVWGSSRKAQPNATPTDCNYINYFPLEEEEEYLDNSSSSSEDVRHLATQAEDWSQFTDQEFVLALGEMVIPNEVAVAVLPDPWTEQELNVAVLEFCYQLPVANTVQLALPPAKEPVTETVIDYAGMTIRELKAECKRLGVKKYSYLKKAELIQLLSSI